MEWFNSLSITMQLFVAVAAGALGGFLACWFGDIITPDDIV